MKMTVLERDDGVTHIVLAGRLDTSGAEEIGESFSEVATAKPGPAIVDLSEIGFLASRGIGLLFANGKRLVQAGFKMVLLNPTGMVDSVLKTSKVDTILPIAHDLDQAHQILGISPSQAIDFASSAEVTEDQSASQTADPAPPITEGELKRRVANELAELDGLNADIAEFLDAHGVPYRAAYAVKLAIDELVVNVIRYAYVDTQTHYIDIELAVQGEQVVLNIEDDGRPFDPRKGPTLDLHAEDREVGGLGIMLVLDMVDALNYRRADERNHVEVRIHLAVEGEPGGSQTGETGDVTN